MSAWSGEMPSSPPGRRPRGHRWFLLLPILTVGLGSFVLPLWAAARTTVAPQRTLEQEDDGRAAQPTVGVPRPVLFKLAGGLGAGALLVLVLNGLAPTDDAGAATGPLAGVSTLLALGLLAIGVLLALRWRGPLFPPVVRGRIASQNANSVPPPVAQALARRSLRQQYRALALRDPALAREIGVGRPHLGRQVDDGGLLDLNSVPAATLVQVAELTPEQADDVVALREQRHGLESIDELVVYGTLHPKVVDRLREYAVFLPR